MSLPKVLICAPTGKTKNYAMREYLAAVGDIKYAGEWQLVLFDNTDDRGENTAHIENTMREMFGANNKKFRAVHSRVKGIKKVIERMAVSTNDCRLYALENNFDKILMLETDVIAPPEIVEELLASDKKVIGAMFDFGEGRFRKLMAQRRIHKAPKNAFTENFATGDEIGFCTGGAKECAAVGLGAIMIDASVLKKISFRMSADEPNAHPDTIFSRDCWLNYINIYSHTGVMCQHKNQADYWFDSMIGIGTKKPGG